jgi:hypothetical protein
MKLMSPVTKMLLALLSPRKQNALDWYARSYPSEQNAVDIFKTDWLSRLPEPPSGLQQTGTARLFTDERIQWFVDQLGGIEGMSALELGPLEGGHAYMLDKLGAASVLSIEANTKAFLKCLVVKELYDLHRVKFTCGDFLEYLRGADQRQFDLCVASGVLYHMENPVELIALLANRCKKHLLLWTHYYDDALVAKKGILAAKFSSSQQADHQGFKHTLYRKEYGPTLYWRGFCGGTASVCNWMKRDDILRCLDHFGFGDLRIAFERLDHSNGPSFAIMATKKS